MKKRGPKERRNWAEGQKSGRVGEINKHILAQSAEGGGMGYSLMLASDRTWLHWSGTNMLANELNKANPGKGSKRIHPQDKNYGASAIAL